METSVQIDDGLAIPEFLKRKPGERPQALAGIRRASSQSSARLGHGPGSISGQYVRARLPADQAEAVVVRDRAVADEIIRQERDRKIEAMKERIERLKELHGGDIPRRPRPRRVLQPRGDQEEKSKMTEKKPKNEPVYRDVSRPVGKVADFRTVRAGSARSVVIEMAGKGSGAMVDEIAEAIDSDRKTVMTHLFCMARDCGFGYEVKGGKVSLQFPGSNTWRDAIKAPAAEKPKKKAA